MILDCGELSDAEGGSYFLILKSSLGIEFKSYLLLEVGTVYWINQIVELEIKIFWEIKELIAQINEQTDGLLGCLSWAYFLIYWLRISKYI